MRAGLEVADLAHLAAGRRHDVETVVAFVLCDEVDRLAVGAHLEAADRALEVERNRARRRIRPVEAHEAIVVVDELRARGRARIQGGAVGGELRLRVACLVAGEPPRLAAARGHDVERLLHDGARRLVARGRRGEDDGAGVRRPGGVDFVAIVVEVAAKAGRVAKRRAGEQVARRGRVAERLQHQGRAALVEPAVPMADRKRIVGARAVFSRLLLVDALLVVGVRHRAGIRHAGEQDGLAIRAPDGRRGAGRDVRHAFGLAAARDIEHVDLRLVLAVALGREGDAARVRAPGRARLGAIREREPARRRAAVRRDRARGRSTSRCRRRRAGRPDTATSLPSGDSTGDPTRFMSQRSSCVIGCFATPSLAVAADAARHRTAHRPCSFIGLLMSAIGARRRFAATRAGREPGPR